MPNVSLPFASDDPTHAPAPEKGPDARAVLAEFMAQAVNLNQITANLAPRDAERLIEFLYPHGLPLPSNAVPPSTKAGVARHTPAQMLDGLKQWFVASPQVSSVVQAVAPGSIEAAQPIDPGAISDRPDVAIRGTSALEHPPISLAQADRQAAAQTNKTGAISDRPDVAIRGTSAPVEPSPTPEAEAAAEATALAESSPPRSGAEYLATFIAGPRQKEPADPVADLPPRRRSLPATVIPQLGRLENRDALLEKLNGTAPRRQEGPPLSAFMQEHEVLQSAFGLGNAADVSAHPAPQDPPSSLKNPMAAPSLATSSANSALAQATLEHPPIRLNQADREAAAQAFGSGAISDRPDGNIRSESALEHPPIRLNQADREAAAQAFGSGAISDRPDGNIRSESALEHPPIRLNQADREAAAQAFGSGAISDRPDGNIRGTSALAPQEPPQLVRKSGKRILSRVLGLIRRTFTFLVVTALGLAAVIYLLSQLSETVLAKRSDVAAMSASSVAALEAQLGDVEKAIGLPPDFVDKLQGQITDAIAKLKHRIGLKG